VLADACTALGVDPRLLVDQLHGQEGGQVQPEDEPQHVPPQTPQQSVSAAEVSSHATLLNIINLQHAHNTAMAEWQEQQQERLLTLLENMNRSTSVRATTVTTITHSALPAAGRVSIVPPRNYKNLAMAGVSLPPMLRIEGSITALDLERMKTKLDSSPNLLMEEHENDDNRLQNYIRRNNDIKIKTGISLNWYMINRTCIKFNIGTCYHIGNHTNTNQELVLRHICGSCLIHRRVEDSTHTAVTCRFKTQSFY
jgi:hypothetical protein